MIRKLLNNGMVFFVIWIVVLIIIPINAVVLDMMLIFNIVLSLAILLITMTIKESLEFSVFPSVLLIMTLFRVALNVSATRLILGNAGQAGSVIQAFGSVVIGSSPIVGFIVFLIIVIAQFVVITKGSERVAEVSARFTLDAMPGKQMAIDADLNAGLINDETARNRRMKIQREADFYGSMDGASKFVKGDAIMSILTVFINLIAGSVIGMTMNKMSFQSVMTVYMISTVGCGLVLQVPALLISTATGVIVTRAASENSLSQDFSKQILAYPAVFTIIGGLLLIMCVIPGFPIPIFLVCGALLLILGNKLRKKKEKIPVEVPKEEAPPSEVEYYKNPENVYQTLTIEPIEMEFGYSLIPLVDESKGGSFIDRLVMLRRKFALDMGMVIPSVRIRDDSSLPPNEYSIKLKGEKVAEGEVLVDHFLCIGTTNGEEEIDGIDTEEPAFHLPAKWVDAENKGKAQMFGYTVIDPLSVIMTHLSEVIKKHAYELLGRREVNLLLDNLKKSNKVLVEEIVPSVISVGDLQKVLSNLLLEQIPIRDLEMILETIGNNSPAVKDMELMGEYVRQALKRTITRKFSEDGSMKVLTVSADIENQIVNSVKKSDRGSYISMDPDMMQKIVSAHIKEVERVKDMVKMPIVLTSPVVRLYYRKLVEQFIPDPVILSFHEIDSDVKVQSVGKIEIVE